MTPLALRLMVVTLALPLIAAAQARPVAPAQPKQPPNRPQPSRVPADLFDLPDFPNLPNLADMPDLMGLGKMDFHLDETRMHEMEMKTQEMALKFEQLADVDVALAHSTMLNFPDEFSAKTMWQADRVLNGRPRQAWAQGDPADSLYRIAREALNRGEYRRAAQLFNEITRKFKTSQYAPDCAYWEAFSRYRLGGTDDLKQALRILEGKGEVQIQQASFNKESNVDVQALRTRVQGALAARGDREAATALENEAKTNGGCDREEISVRAEALSALGQMDRATAIPVVKKVLARRDECTVELRRRALYVAARDADAEAVAIIIDVARNDPDPGVRGEAMRWLPRVAGDNAVPQLEEMLRTSPDEQTQRSALSALASIDSDRARKAVRAIIERTDVSERVRYDAILSLSRERGGGGGGGRAAASARTKSIICVRSMGSSNPPACARRF